MLTLLFFPQPAQAQAGYVNMASVAGDLWPSLNARGPADAIFWTETQLYQWLDEAAKRIARKCGGFVRRNTSVTAGLVNGTYTLPLDHVVTIQADRGDLVLKARNIPELEALDRNWPSTSGQPKAFLEDTQGVKQLTVYPKPTMPYSADTLGLFERYNPAEISVSAAILEVPACIQEYFTFYALAEARGTKETNASMPEVANWFRSLCGDYEQLFATYWSDL